VRISRALPTILLAGVAAEAAARVLEPADAPTPNRPADVADHFTPEEIRRGRRFARPQLVIGLGRGAVELASLVAVTRAVARRPGPTEARTPIAGAATGAALSLVLSLPPLPFSALARQRAIGVGLITQSWRDWALDLVKAGAIQTGMAAAAGGATVAATRRWPRGWWAPVALGSVGFGAALAALAPVVLDPIFNDFTPLEDGEARSDVLELAAAAGVDVGEVYSIDASRRTTAANAYVGGLGPTKRVVLYDTLLDRYSRDELRLVVAHELAHVKHRDVPRAIVYAALVAGPTALAVQQLSWALTDERGTARSLPSLALAAALVSAPIGVLGNRLSRAIERRADAFSLRLAGAPEAFVSFERRIALQNVADLQPPRWVGLLATHPSTLERIAMAETLATAAAAGPGTRAGS
jgi:STE24 endopeptidase